MTPTEKIKAVASFFVRLQHENPSARYVAFEDIRSITGVKNDESRSICDILKAKGFLNFEYFAFVDTPAVFISLNKNQSSYMHPKGAIRFFSVSGDENPSLQGINEDLNFEALEEVVSSEKLRSELARELRPTIRYDKETGELISGEKKVFLGSHNSRVLAEKVFGTPSGTRFLGGDIARLLDDSKSDGKTYLFNVVNRLNQKIEEVSGIAKLVQCKQDKIWIE